MDLPLELNRREQRLAVAAAKAEIEARAQARFAAEQAEYERKLAEREARRERTDRKPGGKPPKPGPRIKDQISLTDAESHIMPTAGGSFAQTYNAQANVDTETHLIVAVEALLADTGYHSRENLERCAAAGIDPYIPEARQGHNPPLAERLADDPPPPQGQPTPAQANAHRLRTREGKARYAKRKATVEPVFGIIKHVQGFR